MVNGRDAERVAETAERLGCSGVVADVSTPEGAAALLEQLPDVDVLVNNTGTFAAQPVFEIPDAEWLRFFRVNVLSGIRPARHYAPRMARRGWGRVVFVSSEAGIQTPTNMVHYGMTKTASSSGARSREDCSAASTGATGSPRTAGTSQSGPSRPSVTRTSSTTPSTPSSTWPPPAEPRPPRWRWPIC